MTNELLIGKITGVHGINGELKVHPLTDDPERFFDLDHVMIKGKKSVETFEVEGVRLHKGAVLLTLAGLTDRTQAEKYKNAEVRISRDDAVDLEEDEFFIADLIALDVVDPKGQKIGKIQDVLTTTGSVYTMEIKTEEKKIYVPFRKCYFGQVDFEKGRIQGEIPDEFFSL